MVGIIAILHHSISYARSVRLEIIEKYIHFYSDVGIFFMVVQLIGGTITAVIHDFAVAVVLMSEVVYKMPCTYCLNKFIDMLVQ